MGQLPSKQISGGPVKIPDSQTTSKQIKIDKILINNNIIGNFRFRGSCRASKFPSASRMETTGLSNNQQANYPEVKY